MKRKFHTNSLRTLYFIAGLSLLSLGGAYAQTDTVFWFAPPDISISSLSGPPADWPIVLRITTENQTAHIRITQPANGGMPAQTLTMSANSTQTIDLTNWLDDIESNPANTILNTGLKITSDAPITAYYQDVSGGSNTALVNNPEVFTLKGQNALGKEFWIPGQNILSNDSIHFTPQPYSSFVLVATEDNTNVTINPSKPIVGHPGQTPFVITLNKGQTYSATSTGQAPQAHLSGTHVTSDKPIAITICDDDVSFFNSCGADMCGDQIVPVISLGTRYVALRGLTASPGDYLFVTATENNTVIERDGTPIITIDAGATEQILLNTDAAYIQASKPVAVWQLSGVGCQSGQSLIPKIECNGSQSVVYTRSVNGKFLLNIVVPAGAEGDFEINGNSSLLTAGQFLDVPGTNGSLRYCRLNLSGNSFPVGTIIKITNANSKFQLGVVEGNSEGNWWGASLSYFSNYNSGAPVQITAQPNPACEGDDIQLTATYISGATYHWQGSDGFTSSINAPVLSGVALENAGTYIVNVDNNNCNMTGSIDIKINAIPKVSLGNDTTICEGDLISLHTTEEYPNGSYLWSNGLTTENIVVRDSGTYSLSITNPPNCQDSDTIKINTQKCDCFIMLPNAFSPNADGRNDIFNPADEISCPIKNYILRIYNRYGQLIFSSQSQTVGWDGTYNGRKADLGIYFFYVRYKEYSSGDQRYFKGDLTLIR